MMLSPWDVILADSNLAVPYYRQCAREGGQERLVLMCFDGCHKLSRQISACAVRAL